MFLGYTPEGNTANFERALASPYVDIMDGTTVGYNLSDGLFRTLPATFRRYNKLTTVEGDIRTHLGLNSADSEPQWTCNSPETTRATASRWIGNTLLNGAGCHVVDFGNNRRLADCPEMLEPIKAGIDIWKKLYNNSSLKGNADVAVIMDPAQIWKQGYPSYFKNHPVVNNIMQFAVKTLNFSGFAHDLLSIDDYLATSADYKAVVFLNTFELNGAKRSALLKKLRKPGVTAIWNYAPGLISEKGFCDRSMSELTGIELRHEKKEFLFKSRRSGSSVKNLSPNGGFEEGLKSWTLSHVDKANGAKISSTFTENAPFEGKKALTVTVKEPLKLYSCLMQKLDLSKETVLPDRLSVAFKGKGSASLVATYWTKEGKCTGYNSRHLAAQEKWQELSMVLDKITPAVKKIFIEIRLNKAAEMTFDNVKLFRQGDALNFWHYGSKDLAFGPRVHSADPKAQELMCYASDGKASLVRKKLADGSIAVFSGIPVNSPAIWAELLGAAGCHKYTAPGYFVRSKGNLLMVSSTCNGNISPGDSIVKDVIKVPAAFQVAVPGRYSAAVDLFTNETFKVTPEGTLELKSVRPRVWFFELR